MPILHPGDPLELTIDSLAYRGAGVARSGGCVVFVHGTCPGERVFVRVTRVHPRFVEAELTSVAESSPSRIQPVCRVPGPDGAPVRVPGCVYDHLSYPAELEAKQRQLEGFLARQARLEDVPGLLQPPTASPADLHYRNKIILHAGFNDTHFGLGYVGDDNRSVIDMPACPLAVPAINDALRGLRDDGRFRDELRPDDDVTLRWTPTDGAVVWIGEPSRHAAPLRESTAFGLLEVPRDGFFQVNSGVGALLIERVVAAALRCSPSALVDVYCGVGVFALAAAHAGIRRTLGVETGRAAIAAARRNAESLRLPAEFACLPADEGLAAALDEVGARGTCVVLDPPRDGLDAEVRRMLVECRPSTLLYVSCAPDTLARDLVQLVRDGGYRVDSCALFDMFPRTAHFETLTVLSQP
jgi:tRNA/tmRNA/rRNA uracil-C5-methylase (TrmA/RlmC/RlmD family)